jgi:hypothetical protein
MTTHEVFQWLSILIGLVAAYLWLRSTWVPLPTSLTDKEWGVPADNQDAVRIGGKARHQVIADKLAEQGRRNAAAAMITALSLLCLAIAQALVHFGY